MTWLLVGVGGALGAITRHALNHVIHQRMLSTTFPLGIFVINVSGSLLIGALAGAVTSGRMQMSHDSRTFLIVGVLGGFTTFSSFSLDTLALVRTGHPGQALFNVVGQVTLSLFAAWAGFKLAATVS